MPPKTVFDRNLEALKSQKVKYTILEHKITEDIQVANTNGYNLTYEGTPFHNEVSPLGEAKAIFDDLKENITSISIIYGIGLGYLFQYAAQNAKGTIILYEPNINILKTAFQLVDFSNEIKKENIFITTDKDALAEIIRLKFNANSYPQVVCLPSYKKLFDEQIKNDAQEISTIVGGIYLDYSYTKNNFKNVTNTILKNIPFLINEKPLDSIKDIYKGKTAVVCSAGPTLAENIETLKKYKDNVVIFAVGPALKSLLKAGITPDFLCIIEYKNCSGQINNIDLSNINMIIEPYTFIKIHMMAKNAKNVFSHISNNLPPNEIWSELSGYDSKEYVSKGTVSYCALNSARILGCAKIIVVGQDLAYLDGQVYSKDSVYKDLKITFDDALKKYKVSVDDIEEYGALLTPSTDKNKRIDVANKRLTLLNEKLTTTKSITGEYIPTEAVYTTFAANIGKYTKNYPNIEFINTSMRGALIKGFKNIPLEEALADSQPIEKISNFPNATCNTEEIIDKLAKIINEFDFAYNKISENKRTLVRFRTEYVRHKSLTKDMLLALKRIVANYIELSVNFAQKVPLYDFISKKEQTEFEAYLQRADNIDLNAALKLAELQTEYLEETTKNLDETKEIIIQVIKKLKGE